MATVSVIALQPKYDTIWDFHDVVDTFSTQDLIKIFTWLARNQGSGWVVMVSYTTDKTRMCKTLQYLEDRGVLQDFQLILFTEYRKDIDRPRDSTRPIGLIQENLEIRTADGGRQMIVQVYLWTGGKDSVTYEIGIGSGRSAIVFDDKWRTLVAIKNEAAGSVVVEVRRGRKLNVPFKLPVNRNRHHVNSMASIEAVLQRYMPYQLGFTEASLVHDRRNLNWNWFVT